jgi:hypothetical protein
VIERGHKHFVTTCCNAPVPFYLFPSTLWVAPLCCSWGSLVALVGERGWCCLEVQSC